MEERDPPTNLDNPDHHYHVSNNEDEEDEYHNYYSIHHVKDGTKINDDNKKQIIRSNSLSHNTYIVQVPKDQIYRIPPPENAEIVKRYQNPVQTSQNGRVRCAYWSLSIIFVVAFIISVFICVHHFTLKPKYPNFSIKHFAIKKNPTISKKNSSPKFQVSMETSNPNSVNDIGYVEGNATLKYKGKVLGHGIFPPLENEGSRRIDSMDVIVATSSKGGLPNELQFQNSNNKKNKSLNLNLLLSIPLKMKTWLYNKKVNVKALDKLKEVGSSLWKVNSELKRVFGKVTESNPIIHSTKTIEECDKCHNFKSYFPA